MAWRSPRYRIEHRQEDTPALIVAFADAELVLRSVLAVQLSRHVMAQTGGTLVVVDQETEGIVSVHQVPPPG